MSASWSIFLELAEREDDGVDEADDTEAVAELFVMLDIEAELV